jgi:DNA-directed RNA polymerase specialized sigma24 family protein
MPHLNKIAKKLSITKYDLLSSINWVMTKILNNVENLDKQKNILSYITNSVRNFCIDEYRKVVVRTRREGEFKSIAKVSYRGIPHTLQFMLEDLTKNKEEVTILSKIVLENKEIQDISEELSVPKTTIDELLARVKAELST